MPYSKYKDGEFINLHWEFEPDVYYVRGHVDESAFKSALVQWHGDSFFGDEPIALRHAYAFWSQEGPKSVSGVDRFLRECPRRPGAFKITAMDVEVQP